MECAPRLKKVLGTLDSARGRTAASIGAIRERAFFWIPDGLQQDRYWIPRYLDI